jgi:rod shape-determining protein MreC
MRDSRRARLILAVLLLTAFTLITLDYRSGGGGPLRRIGNTVFGPVEDAVNSVVHPVTRFFASLAHLNSYRDENDRLRAENEQLKEQLRLTAADRAHLRSAEALLNLAGRAQYRVVAAHVVAVGSSMNFEWTATIDAGSRDGVQPNETVINGDGLVGKTLDVGPTTATILLGPDPDFTAGARLAGSQQIGTVDGGGRQPMTFTALGSNSQLAAGDQLVTFGDKPFGDRPFVPEVPIGRIARVEEHPGQLAVTAVITPYVDFTSLDLVAVVVAVPRTIPRDSLLPPSPTPSTSPSPTPTGSAGPGPSGSASPTPSGTP